MMSVFLLLHSSKTLLEGGDSAPPCGRGGLESRYMNIGLSVAYTATIIIIIIFMSDVSSSSERTCLQEHSGE